jgi:hypothetical protein
VNSVKLGEAFSKRWQSRAKLLADRRKHAMSKQRKFKDNQLIEAVATSHSIRIVLEKIGLTPAGGNYETVKKHIQELKLDTSHFLGQAILRNKTHAYNTRPLDAILVHGKLESTWRLKN